MRRERAPLTQIPGSAPGESIPQNATSREQTHFKSQRSRARCQSVVVFFLFVPSALKLKNGNSYEVKI